MRLHLQLRLFVLFCSLPLPAFAQLDSSTLRGKYGAPLNREVFRMPSGFDLVVDYGANNQVCKLEVPALMPSNEKVSNTSVMKQRMYNFLEELVSGSMRGKEAGRRMVVSGTISILSIEYEHVTIDELQHADQPFGNNTITVRFNDNKCPNASAQQDPVE